MKIYRKILLLVIALIIAMNVNVIAADYATEPSDSINDVTLKGAAEAKIGDVVEITVSAKCTTGIGGLDSVLTWDSSKVEFTNEADFQLSGLDTSTNEFRFSVLCDEDANEADIATLKFKILDTATVGEKLSIKFSKIEIIDNNYESVNVVDKEQAITVIDSNGSETPGGEENPGENEEKTLSSIAITTKATKLTYKVGEKFDKTGMAVTATYSDGTSKEITGYTYSPNGKLSINDKTITITYTEGEVTKTTTQTITVESAKTEEPKEPNKKDETIANKPINNAGVEQYAIALISVVAIAAVVLYKKCKKYRDIK